MEEVAKIETSVCLSYVHAKSGSPYAKDKVPKKMFHKDPENLSSPLLKSCYDCRNYNTKKRKENKEQLQVKQQNDENDFQCCPSERHTSKNSVYPKDKVPKSHFLKNPNDPKSKMCRMCFDCRKKANDRNKIGKEKAKLSEVKSQNDREVVVCDSNKDTASAVYREEIETVVCPDHKHLKSGSIYPRDKVPKNLFLKDSNDPESPMCKSCYDCRSYHRKKNKERKEKMDLLVLNNDTESEFQPCTSIEHSKNVSVHPKDKVPRNLFLKDPSNPNSKVCKMCFDCRNYKNEKYKERIESINTLASIVSVDSEFGVCTSVLHTRASTYPRDKVPKNLFKKYLEHPNSETCKTCFDCRKFTEKVREILNEKWQEQLEVLASNIDENSEFQLCTSKIHTENISNYPRDKVPKKMFLKDPDNPESEKLQNCSDCRNKYKEWSSNNREKLKEEIRLLNSEDPNAELLACNGIRHQLSSKYKREEVPRHMFLKFPENPRSPLLNTCSDCRKYDNEIHGKDAAWKVKRQTNVKEGEFYCSGCFKIKPLEDQATNLDGEKSMACNDCKISQKNYKQNTVELKRQIKIETIRKNKCSCEKCKKIYLQPENENSGVTELSTYERDNTAYVTYKDKEYTVDDFLDEFEELLELRILDYDHLTEEEQRERGLLGEDDVFVPKKCNVTRLSGEDNIRLETAKTQLIDCRCHPEETIRRNPVDVTGRSAPRDEKAAYVNELKCKGCSICGFYDPDLLCFLEFDHLDVDNKIDIISNMVADPAYTLEDIIVETSELITRILCRFCHRIHTDWQRKAGLIRYK